MLKTGKMGPVVNESSRMGCYEDEGIGAEDHYIINSPHGNCIILYWF